MSIYEAIDRLSNIPICDFTGPFIGLGEILLVGHLTVEVIFMPMGLRDGTQFKIQNIQRLRFFKTPDVIIPIGNTIKGQKMQIIVPENFTVIILYSEIIIYVGGYGKYYVSMAMVKFFSLFSYRNNKSD